jgi:hypothetical protein
MPSAITPLELRQFVESTLSGYLGTYTFPSGTMTAIALLPHPTLGYYFPPNDWSVSGLEVVIVAPTANPSNSRQMTGGDLAINYGWQIFLNQHDLKGQLQTAMEILMVAIAQQYHILKDVGGYVKPDESGLVIASAKIVILDPVVMANVPS